MGISRPKASLLLDLAPHGGCLARRIAAPAGGLLHHLFTLAPLGERSVFCGPVPSVYTLPGVTRRAALRCADFPRDRSPASIRPTWFHYNGWLLYDN